MSIAPTNCMYWSPSSISSTAATSPFHHGPGPALLGGEDLGVCAVLAGGCQAVALRSGRRNARNSPHDRDQSLSSSRSAWPRWSFKISPVRISTGIYRRPRGDQCVEVRIGLAEHQQVGGGGTGHGPDRCRQIWARRPKAASSPAVRPSRPSACLRIRSTNQPGTS